VQNRVRNLTKGFARKWRLSRQHFEQNSAHGKEIRARVHGPAPELFGGRIPRCAEKDSRQRGVRKSGKGFFRRVYPNMLRDPKVQQFCAAVRKHDVARFQIPVDDSNLMKRF